MRSAAVENQILSKKKENDREKPPNSRKRAAQPIANYFRNAVQTIEDFFSSTDWTRRKTNINDTHTRKIKHS